MKNSIIRDQRFNKSANDIITIIKEFKAMLRKPQNSESLVKQELLKNEFKSAASQIIQELEETDRTKITVLTELTRADLDVLKSITVEFIPADLANKKPQRIIFNADSDSQCELLNEFADLLKNIQIES